jgi:hypothetical protein
MLILVLMTMVFFLPFILALIAIIVIALIIAAILARLGLLPGMRAVYWFGRAPRERDDGRSFRFDDGETPRESGDGWYQSTQEGEVITLPDTALRKENTDE